MKPQVRALLTVIFLALLALPAVLERMQQADASVAARSARHGFKLEESARTAGLVFQHRAPELDRKLEHIMPQIASMGAGVSVADYDRDGLPDVYVINSGEGAPNALFRNKGDGTFEDVAAKLGVADLSPKGHGCANGGVWGDYDNDGYEDLLVYRWGEPLLFHNDGGKTFTRVARTGFPPRINANSAIWLDYDRDGKLDVFIAGYWDERVDLWSLQTTKVMPESFEYALNGGRKYLFRGRGDGTFEDVTGAQGIDSRRWALAAVAADIFGSGYPDIFIANDYGVSEVWRNNQGKGFTEVGRELGIGAAPKSGMNAACGDILNRGALAFYVSNISEEGVLLQGNNLWVPKSRATPEAPLKFENMARVLGVDLGGWSFGAQFGDLNNDGTLDLYLVNGYISADPNASYWYDFSKVAGGHKSIINDAANWPPMNGRSLAGYQAKKVWVNDGTGRFTDAAVAVGVQDRFDGRAVALADLSNRGALDVLVANQKGPLLYYKNTPEADNAWLGLDLEGTRSNRSAIGARVTLAWSGRRQVQEVHGGSGFSAQNDRRLHFGLGKSPKDLSATIRWPSGQEQTLKGLTVNTMHKVKEPS